MMQKEQREAFNTLKFMKKRRQSMSSLFKCDGSERRTKHEIWKSITHHIQQFVAPFVRAPIKLN